MEKEGSLVLASEGGLEVSIHGAHVHLGCMPLKLPFVWQTAVGGMVCSARDELTTGHKRIQSAGLRSGVDHSSLIGVTHHGSLGMVTCFLLGISLEGAVQLVSPLKEAQKLKKS